MDWLFFSDVTCDRCVASVAVAVMERRFILPSIDDGLAPSVTMTLAAQAREHHERICLS
jgi:hypothetical protein